MANKEDVLRKVAALLAKADSTEYSEERDALIRKADDLMLAYAIDSWEVESAKPAGTRAKPSRKSIRLFGRDNPIAQPLVDLFHEIAMHCRCKAVYGGLQDPRYGVTATVVGFDSDIEYTEMLYTSLHLQLARELEPHPDLSLTFVENLVMLKEAGLKWERIHNILSPDVPWTRNIGVRFTKLYHDYCEEQGRPQLKTNPLTYQKNFARGFVGRVVTRLYQIRLEQAKAQEQQQDSNRMALVLVERKDEVKAMFDELFPATKVVRPKGEGKFDYAARNQGSAAGDRADLTGGRSTVKGSQKAIQ